MADAGRRGYSASLPNTVSLLAVPARRDSETAPFNLDSFKLHPDFKLPRGPGPGPPAHFKKLEHSEERHLAGVRDSGAGQRKRGEDSGRGDGRNRKREMQDACVLVLNLKPVSQQAVCASSAASCLTFRITALDQAKMIVLQAKWAFPPTWRVLDCGSETLKGKPPLGSACKYRNMDCRCLGFPARLSHVPL